MRNTLLLAGMAVLIALGHQALTAEKKFALTIDNLMRGPGLYGYEPRAVRWSGSSGTIYFQWKQAAEKALEDFDTWSVRRDGSGLRRLTEDEARLAPPAIASQTRDFRLGVYARDGDLFLYDYSKDTQRRLTRTGDVESDPAFTRDGKRVCFTRGSNLYVMPLEGGMLEQLTDVRPPGAAPGSAPAEPPVGGGQGRGLGRQQQSTSTGDDEDRKGTESQEWIKAEERKLLESVGERAAKREQDRARRRRENPRKPLRLQARQNIVSLRLTPDEKYVIAAVSEQDEGSKNTIVPSFVTESAYTEDLGSRAKVGDRQPRNRVVILEVATGEAKWLEHGIKEDVAGGKPRDRAISLSQPVWSEDGTKAFVQGRAADNKDRWIFALEPETGKLRVLASDHDDAWINGFGMSAAGWSKGDSEIWFESERGGYGHLYAVPFAGGEARALTSGKFEVLNARLSRDRSKFYLVTSEGGPEERHVWTMPAEGGARTRLTAMPGRTDAFESPDDGYLALIRSYTNQPPELYVQENRAGAEARKLTASPAAEFQDYRWIDAPIVQVPARDGTKVPAQIFKPANFQAGGPAVIFVHGAGYTQNVHRGWSDSYAHEYLFHHFLMEHGYLVLALDYRGSAGYGRDWRTAIYRHMGGRDLDDQVDAARWLIAEHRVGAKRIGIYGGSYGGFITLMAMFTQPDLFAAGAALRPVTDWAHYNHNYTSNILNEPQKDAEAYRRSSPIYFAEGLKGALLICHGMVDTNVHFQDTVRLVERLIELRKENWELAVYPVEDHGFQEPASWADEYKRIFRLFETNLAKR